jgi:hypothetical protein
MLSKCAIWLYLCFFFTLSGYYHRRCYIIQKFSIYLVEDLMESLSQLRHSKIPSSHKHGFIKLQWWVRQSSSIAYFWGSACHFGVVQQACSDLFSNFEESSAEVWQLRDVDYVLLLNNTWLTIAPLRRIPGTPPLCIRYDPGLCLFFHKFHGKRRQCELELIPLAKELMMIVLDSCQWVLAAVCAIADALLDDHMSAVNSWNFSMRFVKNCVKYIIYPLK